MGVLEGDEDLLARGGRGAVPGVPLRLVGRALHHVVGRDVARGPELQRREERIGERRGLLVGDAQRVGVRGHRDGEHRDQRGDGDDESSHGGEVGFRRH